MFFEKRDQPQDKRFDRVAGELVRAAGLSEFETDSAASAPFLYARVRARIDAERQRKENSVPVLAM
ncbi:MAG TPA: hypothetical protein VNS63_21805, partial [Blastocatellia bacterium]|nr:hypothetical protein [Blastocatellia bacterium]